MVLQGLSAALEGFLLGASLIIAIGAQNAFVLRQGLIGRHVGPIVFICAASDALLISLGVAGMGSLVSASSQLFVALAAAGALFLAWYGVGAARRALHPATLEAAESRTLSLKAAIALALALTWGNPHVYLDTVVLLGGISGSHAPDVRVFFALGAMAASVVWFTALGYGARFLQPIFRKPIAWRCLDGAIAVIMLTLALKLAQEAIGRLG